MHVSKYTKTSHKSVPNSIIPKNKKYRIRRAVYTSILVKIAGVCGRSKTTSNFLCHKNFNNLTSLIVIIAFTILQFAKYLWLFWIRTDLLDISFRTKNLTIWQVLCGKRNSITQFVYESLNGLHCNKGFFSFKLLILYYCYEIKVLEYNITYFSLFSRKADVSKYPCS